MLPNQLPQTKINNTNKRISPTKREQQRQEVLNSIPSCISVLGKKIEVRVCKLKGLHGDYDRDTNVIRIHIDTTVEEAKKTLFHESIHAALAISGLTELLTENVEEAMVRMLENTFYDIVDIEKYKIDKD